MLKRILIIALIDLVVLWFCVQSANPDPSITIAIIFYVPALFIVNLVAGLILKLRKNEWANAILINAIMSPVIFYYLFINAIDAGVNGFSKNYYFQKGKETFQINLSVADGRFHDSLTYDFYRMFNGGSGSIGINGRYYMNKDTVMLSIDSGRVLKLYGLYLYDYPMKGDTIKLRSSR